MEIITVFFPFSWTSPSLRLVHDHIVNIVSCGASPPNTWPQLACFNTRLSSVLLILLPGCPRSLERGERALINSESAIRQRSTFKCASCLSLSTPDDPGPNSEVHSGLFLMARIRVSRSRNKCTAHVSHGSLSTPHLCSPPLPPSLPPIPNRGPWEALTLGADSLQP